MQKLLTLTLATKLYGTLSPSFHWAHSAAGSAPLAGLAFFAAGADSSACSAGAAATVAFAASGADAGAGAGAVLSSPSSSSLRIALDCLRCFLLSAAKHRVGSQWRRKGKLHLVLASLRPLLHALSRQSWLGPPRLPSSLTETPASSRSLYLGSLPRRRRPWAWGKEPESAWSKRAEGKHFLKNDMMDPCGILIGEDNGSRDNGSRIAAQIQMISREQRIQEFKHCHGHSVMSVCRWQRSYEQS